MTRRDPLCAASGACRGGHRQPPARRRSQAEGACAHSKESSALHDAPRTEPLRMNPHQRVCCTHKAPVRINQRLHVRPNALLPNAPAAIKATRGRAPRPLRRACGEPRGRASMPRAVPPRCAGGCRHWPEAKRLRAPNEVRGDRTDRRDRAHPHTAQGQPELAPCGVLPTAKCMPPPDGAEDGQPRARI